MSLKLLYPVLLLLLLTDLNITIYLYYIFYIIYILSVIIIIIIIIIITFNLYFMYFQGSATHASFTYNYGNLADCKSFTNVLTEVYVDQDQCYN